MADSQWREMTLGDFVTLQRGHDLPDRHRREGTVPVVGSFGVTGYHDESKAPGPGVTVGRSGASFGVVSYSQSPFWPLNTALYVRDFHGNDERFAYYFLRSIDFTRFNSGSAQPSLNRNFIHPITVKVPPPTEQRAIASILGALDDKIELNRRINATLETMARALFMSWFVDFDPVRAKVQGRETALAPEIAALFPDSFVQSELGQIPVGWSVGSVEDLCTSISSGGTPTRMKSEYWMCGTIPWFKTGELKDGPLIQSAEHITESALAQSSCKLWPAGTILFALYASPTVGRLGILTRPGTSNQAAAGLIADLQYGAPFLFQTLLASRERLQHIAVGAAQQNINLRVLKEHKIVTPASNLAGTYSALVQPIVDRQAEIAQESNTLTALRDALLPKLISGELRVRGAERIAEKSA